VTCKFKIFVRGGHCDYSPQAPKKPTYATMLLLPPRPFLSHLILRLITEQFSAFTFKLYCIVSSMHVCKSGTLTLVTAGVNYCPINFISKTSNHFSLPDIPGFITGLIFFVRYLQHASSRKIQL